METDVRKTSLPQVGTGTDVERKEPIFNIKTHKRHENPKVSVIVPVYKVDKYLTQCLNSIVNQTMEELEIIIVDEGDQDRCREIIDFFEKNDPRIVAPHQKNGGYAASCNLGMDMARGEYIAFVESDDYIEPEMYEEMYEYAKVLNADVVKTSYYEYFSDGRNYESPTKKFMSEQAPQNTCFSLKEFCEIWQTHPSVWAGLYKAEYINREHIRYVDKKGSYVDAKFREVLLRTDKIAWLDKAYYHWRIDSDASSVTIFKIDQMIERWEEFLSLFTERKTEFDKYYAKNLVGELCRNIFDAVQYRNCRPKGENWKRIGKIVQFFPEEAILASDEVSPFTKKEMILCKRNPSHTKSILTRLNALFGLKRKINCACERIVNPILLFISFVGFTVFSKLAYYLYVTGTKLPFVAAELSAAALFCAFIITISLVVKVIKKCRPFFKSIFQGFRGKKK